MGRRKRPDGVDHPARGRSAAIGETIMTYLELIAVPAAALLVAALLVKLRRTLCHQSDEGAWTGRFFDAKALSPRLHQLRQDYTRKAHSHARPAAHRQAVLRSARRSLWRLGYFGRQRTAEPAEKEHGTPGRLATGADKLSEPSDCPGGRHLLPRAGARHQRVILPCLDLLRRSAWNSPCIGGPF